MMNNITLKRIERPVNIGLLAHVDAGKTTLSEALLYESGFLRKMGRVDHQDSFLDSDVQERERGITIFSKLARLSLHGRNVTLLDTPGHVDFSAEMERTLQVLDACILIISGSDGVQSHTRTLWELMENYELPVFIFVNKMDISERSREQLMKELKGALSPHCTAWEGNLFTKEPGSGKTTGEPDKKNASSQGEEERKGLQSMLGRTLTESDWTEELAVADEAMMEEYLEEGSVLTQEVLEAVWNRKIFPVFFGSALKDQGVHEFARELSLLMPMKEDPPEAFGARVYKIARDEKGTRLTFLKVTKGSLSAKTQLDQGKVDEIRLYSGRRFDNVQEIPTGTICAVTGLENTFPGQGIGNEEQAKPPMLTGFLTYKVEILDNTDLHKVLVSLRILEEEDPQLHVVFDEEHGVIHLQLMGAVQLEVISRLAYDRFHFQIRFGKGEIMYRETIARPVEGVGHYEPLRHYAEVHLLMEPLESGSGLQFDSLCSEEVLSGNFQRLVLTHLEEKEHKGVLIGAPLTDMKITLVAGRAHLKHTEGGDFRQATYRAVRQGLMHARSILLEPYIRFELSVPSDCVGRAMNDLTSRDAVFEMSTENAAWSLDGVESFTLLKGTGPAEALQDYSLEVASYTRGHGRFRFRFDRYQKARDAQKIVEERQYDPEADLANTPHSVFCSHGAGMIVPWDQVESYMHLPAYPLEEEDEEIDEQARRAASYRWSLNQWVSDAQEEEEEADSASASASSAKRKPGSGGLGTDSKEDQELMAIFERTYGSTTRKEFEKVKKPAYKSRKEIHNTKKIDSNMDHVEVHLPEDQDTYLLIDGYNIIHAWDVLEKQANSISFEAARNQLQERVSNYQGYTKENCIIVYDAYRVKGGTERVIHENNITIVFTKEAETADTYIERASYQLKKQRFKVKVATSDGPEQMIVMGHGAIRMSAPEFLTEMKMVEERIRDQLSQIHLTRSPNSVREAFKEVQGEKS